MKTLVIYDSTYGNTEKVAKAMIYGDEVLAKKPQEVKEKDVKQAELIVVGSPVQGGRPTTRIQEFISRLQQGSLEGKMVAAFDTRFPEKEQKMLLRALMKVIGYASPKISELLTKKGGKLACDPEGFVVEGKSGPLRRGETERALRWIKKIAVRA